MTDDDDKLARMLADGWAIAGYSAFGAPDGAITHSVLMRNGADLRAVSITMNAGAEIRRAVDALSPQAQKRKSLFR